MKAVRSTLKDIAKATGVSHVTVLRALSGKGVISPATRDKVLKAAARLDYRPNASARSLRTGKIGAIAVVVSELGSAFVVDLLTGIEAALQGKAYDLHIHTGRDLSTESTRTGRLKALERVIKERSADAVVYVSPSAGEQLPDAAALLGFPMVVVEGPAKGPLAVRFDNLASGALGARTLLKSGRRRIALVNGGTDVLESQRDRLSGFKGALSKAGQKWDPRDLYTVHRYRFDTGFEVLEAILKSKRPYDAIFCTAGDWIAAGIMSAAQARGIKIPDDLALLGHDNFEIAQVSGLSTIEQPVQDMGRSAIGMAIQLLEKPAFKIHSKVFTPKAILRRST